MSVNLKLSAQLFVFCHLGRDPEDGPGGRQDENRRVMVMHRHPERGMHCGGQKFSAPLLLWLPPSETYDPELHVRKLGGGSSSSKQLFGPSGGRLLGGGGETEYAVSENAPIWRHIERMMQPFRAPPALCQQPVLPAAAADGVDGEAPGEQQQQQQAGAAMSTEQQPAASTGPGDVSMAAAPGLPPSPSPEPCSTSKPAGTSAAAAAPAAPGLCASGPAAGSSGGAWGSDGGAADQTNNKAASEAGDNNSTWGSHGSEAAHSDMDADLGCDETIDEAVGVGISRAASQQQLAEDPPAAAAEGGGAAMESDGEVDATAALAAEQLGGAEGQAASPAAAAGAGSSGGGMLGSGGVHVAPLDIWSAQTQVGVAVLCLVNMLPTA